VKTRTVTLSLAQWDLLEKCLHDLAWHHGYGIGSLRSAISEQLDEEYDNE